MKVKDWADPRRRHLKEKGWVRCDRATGPNQSKELLCVQKAAIARRAELCDNVPSRHRRC